MVLMRSLPIDSQTLRTTGEFFLLVENKIRDVPFHFLPCHFFEKMVAEETSGKKDLFLQRDKSLFNELP